MNTKSETDLVLTFRDRAKHLRNQGYLILFLISTLLASGIWIFFNAGEITRSDIKVEKKSVTSDELRKQEIELDKEISAVKYGPEGDKAQLQLLEKYYNAKSVISTEFNLLETKIRETSSSIEWEANEQLTKENDLLGEKKAKSFRSRRINILEFYKLPINDSITDFYEKATINPYTTTITHKILSKPENAQEYKNLYSQYISSDLKFTSLNSKIRALRIQIEDAHNSYLQKKYKSTNKDDIVNKLLYDSDNINQSFMLVRNKELEEKYGLSSQPTTVPSSITVPFLIQTNITRFGPLLLILFFVGILVNLYRYNIRLSGYYDARADALEFIAAGIDGDIFEKIVSSVSPKHYDFGKTPTSPADQAVELVKTITENSK